jgi:iron-sulfur cluster assembly protein
MIEVTTAATEQLIEYFKGKTRSPIRIFLNQCGCAGPGLALALDEPKDEDENYVVEGFTFLVEKSLMEKAKPIKLDFFPNGFKIDCGMDFGPASSCSSCGTAGSCH